VRLGLVTDIHNHAAEVGRALDLFATARVDQVVTLGDTCDAYARSVGATEVASLLLAAGAVGVWGNHDFSLCSEVSPAVRERFPEVVLRFMSGMRARLEMGDCHFSHKEASVDPYDAAQLWDVSDGPLDLLERARLGFAATAHRCQFVGHYHRWWAATPAGQVEWDGSRPLVLDPSERYFVVVGPTCEGWCAILDMNAGVLQPMRCGLP
jgi:predicted phosphodiesterase